MLASDETVSDFEALTAHLRKRAAGLGGHRLVVLRYEWGSIQHLQTLGNYLRKLIEERAEVPFHVLMAGGMRSAWLIHHVERFSAFKDAPRREVPDCTVDEVRQFLAMSGMDGPLGEGRARGHRRPHGPAQRGGDRSGGALDQTSVTERLARSPVLREVVRDQLREDDRSRYSERRHSRFVLGQTFAGQEVRALDTLDHQTDYAEVRLFFDGLVKRDPSGRTVLRCDAAARVAKEALARRDDRP